MKLIAFDGDDTLWTPLSLNLSDRTPDDDIGWPDYTYKATKENPLIAERDDAALFVLRPEVREVLEALHNNGVLTGVISYNHEGNVRRILEAFGIGSLVDYIVAEWHSNKDKMLQKMLAMASADGHPVTPGEAMLVDDDPYSIYHRQCVRIGAAFRCFGKDIHDLREVLPLAGITLYNEEQQATGI